MMKTINTTKLCLRKSEKNRKESISQNYFENIETIQKIFGKL